MLTALGLALLLGLPLTIGGWLCHQACHRRLPRRLMWLWLALAGVIALTVALLATHPGLFPMHGFSGPEDSRTVGQAFQKYPLAFALATADMEASYFLENEDRL